MENTNEFLKKVFLKYNIEEVGVTDAALFNEAADKSYNKLIVALFPYYAGYPEDSNISIYAHGKDYHIVTRDILSKVAKELSLSSYDIYSDIGPEIERQMAIDAGLCFKGKNDMCINSKYGSYFFIGYIACDADYEVSAPNNQNCIKCNKCIEACPGKALVDKFSPERCLSAITQKRGELTEWERELIKNNGYIFGCDICQRVCPHNEKAEFTPITEFIKDRVTKLSLGDLEGLTNKTFKEKYGDRAFSWRGKQVLERNLKIFDK